MKFFLVILSLMLCSCNLIEYDSKNIEFDKKVIAELIQRHYPDFRRTINELQRYSVRGKIDSGILFSLSEANNKELVQTLKGKKFNNAFLWGEKGMGKSSLIKSAIDFVKKKEKEKVLLLEILSHDLKFLPEIIHKLSNIKKKFSKCCMLYK